MIVEVADHPLILLGELEVSLPEAVAMLPLESVLTPNSSRRRNRIVQSSIYEDAVGRLVTDRRDTMGS